MRTTRRATRDFSGTGNTLNANGPIVRRLILDSLRYWVEEMHVDGFRFDLAAVLSRGEDGEPLTDPPILWEIETDPVLAGTKLIAEAWDAGGLYQVGSFVGDRWVEWNGRFRDDVRAFVKGDPGMVPVITDRLLGSADLYGHKHRDAQASINFVTCHDGFTLEDLVSYDRKHNEANGEGDRDGNDQNLSWNCGVEGPTTTRRSRRLRGRQVRNFLAIDDAVARRADAADGRRGAPDPGRQQQRLLPRRRDGLVRLDRSRAARRRPALHAGPDPAPASAVRPDGGPGRDQPARPARRVPRPSGAESLSASRTSRESSHSIALTVRAPAGALHLILNAYWEPLDFELPVAERRRGGWRRIIDTARPSPHDIALDFGGAAAVDTPTFRAEARSIVLLAAAVDGVPRSAR